MDINDPQENYRTGFIAVYRSIRNHWIFKSDKHFKWWIIMLMEVNHQSNKMALGYKLYNIQKGQSSNSLRTWANLFNTGTKQVSNFFDLLESDKMITRKTIGKGKHSTTLITIENYSNYQYSKETQETTQKTTQGKRKGNAKETQGKRNRHTNNNNNNYNNENKENPPPKKITKEEAEEAFIDWFNKKRSKALNKKSNLKALSDTDKSNLHKLRKKYNGKDFDIAFNALVKSKWALDNNGIKPDHFLRNNNFNSYYVKGQDMQQDKPKSLKEIIKNQYHG